MARPSENVWKLIEALQRRGFGVDITMHPVDHDGHQVTVAIQGFEKFRGVTVDAAFLDLARSRCWDELNITMEELEEDYGSDSVAESPARPTGPRRRVKVVDIIDDVHTAAMGYGSPFRADHIADELNVFPAAIGHALKKLKWPRSQDKTRVVVNGREVECYVYLPATRLSDR